MQFALSALNIARKVAMITTVAVITALPAKADEVGRVGVDWVGNDIIIEAFADPKVQGVTCHISYFERSIWDRLSNASIACRQTGPIVIGAIDKDADGEQVFSESRSLIFKSLRVTRIFDTENQVLVYLTHANELTEGSAKMSLSSVPLYAAGIVAKTPALPAP
jgi:CreA protein